MCILEDTEEFGVSNTDNITDPNVDIDGLRRLREYTIQRLVSLLMVIQVEKIIAEIRESK